METIPFSQGKFDVNLDFEAEEIISVPLTGKYWGMILNSLSISLESLNRRNPEDHHVCIAILSTQMKLLERLDPEAARLFT